MNIILMLALFLGLAACGDDAKQTQTNEADMGTQSDAAGDNDVAVEGDAMAQIDMNNVESVFTPPVRIAHTQPRFEPDFALVTEADRAVIAWSDDTNNPETGSIIDGNLRVGFAATGSSFSFFDLFDATAEPDATAGSATLYAGAQGTYAAWNHRSSGEPLSTSVKYATIGNEKPVVQTLQAAPSIILGTGFQQSEQVSLMTLGLPTAEPDRESFLHWTQIPGDGSVGSFPDESGQATEITGASIRALSVGGKIITLYEKPDNSAVFFESFESGLAIQGDGKQLSNLGIDRTIAQGKNHVAYFEEIQKVENDDLLGTRIGVVLINTDGTVVSSHEFATVGTDQALYPAGLVFDKDTLWVFWTRIVNLDSLDSQVATLEAAQVNAQTGEIVKESAVVVELERFSELYPAGSNFPNETAKVSLTTRGIALIYGVGFFEFDDASQNSGTFAGLDYYFQWLDRL